MNPILYIVIPCYNEEEVLPVTSVMFRDEIRDLIEKDKISSESRVLFVDDGSKDSTWQIISSLAIEDPVFTGIRQSRNRGHQSSVLAGLMEAGADMTHGLTMTGVPGGVHIAPCPDRDAVCIQSDDPETVNRFRALAERLESKLGE